MSSTAFQPFSFDCRTRIENEAKIKAKNDALKAQREADVEMMRVNMK